MYSMSQKTLLSVHVQTAHYCIIIVFERLQSMHIRINIFEKLTVLLASVIAYGPQFQVLRVHFGTFKVINVFLRN